MTEIWPEVRVRLRAYLLARDVSAADADDIVQDVAERLIRHRIDFVDADDLLRWCVPVARHASIDRHRRGARLVSVHAVSEHPCAEDFTETVGTKLRLLQVVDGLSRLSHTDRETLVEAAEEAGGIVDGATRVRRHRARKRLLELVGPPAVAGWVIRLVRRFGRTGAAVVAPAAVAASFIIGVGGGGVAAPPVTAMAPNHAQVVSEAHAPTATRLPRAQASVGATTAISVRTASPLTRRPQAPVRVYGHERRAQDQGTVCLARVPVLTGVCVGPKTTQLGRLR